jgi:UDP-GlcNAc:undecaprenyl-phosphate GlcNAc-1-phosphate transferase
VKVFVIYAIFFVCIYAFSLLLYSILLRFARTLGIRENSDVVRWASTAKPALGGVTFYIVFLISFTAHSLVFDSDILSRYDSLALLAAGTAAFLMGLADDAYNTRPLLKFLVQVACAAMFIYSGTYISLFDSDWANYIFTVIWVVGIMNSINMLDNMDAISTITSMFILLGALTFMALNGMYDRIEFMLLVGICGTLFGFLFFNWNPSRMYMGDTGSQFIGIILAYVGIKFFWNSHFQNGEISQWQQFFSVLIAFMLPIIDTTIVVINRISRGQSPFVGGKDHTTHNLSYLGLSDSQVALVFAGVSVVLLMSNYFIFRFTTEWTTSLGLGVSGLFLSIFAILFYICHIYKYRYVDK